MTLLGEEEECVVVAAAVVVENKAAAEWCQHDTNDDQKIHDDGSWIDVSRNNLFVLLLALFVVA